DVVDARGTGLLGPDRARPRRHGDPMPARVQPPGQLAQLDRRAGEVIRLRVQLEDPQGGGAAHHPTTQTKNARTAETTSSTSASVWPADSGRVRISRTMR